MQTKNPYTAQLQNLKLALENDLIGPADMCQTVLNTSKRDTMSFADAERKMLSDLCTQIVNYRAENMDMWVNDPQALLIGIQTLVAQYAEERYKAMLLKKSEFEFSEAMLHSAIQSEKGMLQ